MLCCIAIALLVSPLGLRWATRKQACCGGWTATLPLVLAGAALLAGLTVFCIAHFALAPSFAGFRHICSFGVFTAPAGGI